MNFLEKLIHEEEFQLVKIILNHVDSIESGDSLVNMCIKYNDITFLGYIQEKVSPCDIYSTLSLYLGRIRNYVIEYLVLNYINIFETEQVNLLFKILSTRSKDTHMIKFFLKNYNGIIEQKILDDSMYDCIKNNESNTKVVQYLIDLGADVNYEVNCMEMRGEDTSLLNAIENGNLDFVKCLLKNGANVFYNEHDPRDLAYEIGNFEILQVILEYDGTSEDYFFKHCLSDIDNKLLESYIRRFI